MIPHKELAALVAIIVAAVTEHGHPDNLEQGHIEGEGVSPATAEIAFAILTSELFPSDPAEAVSKWLRLLGDFTEQTPDLWDCIHQGDSTPEDLMWRSPTGTGFPVRKVTDGGAS